MKIEKVVLVSLVALLSLNASNAQGIEKAKTLYFTFHNTEFPTVSHDSVVISKISNDTTWFSTGFPTVNDKYYRAGNKVYREINSSNAILYYDYNLLKDDFFISTSGTSPDTFIVDSVYFKKMYHRTFKAWHLSLNRPKNHGIVKWEWVEGLGELRVGWDTKEYNFTDRGWEIKGICLNDSVIHWDTSYNYFKDRNPSPSCMFDSISKRLSIPDISKDINFNLFPNPATESITINSKTSCKVSIMDVMGKTYLSDIPVQEGTQTIDVSILPAGTYMVTIRYGNEIIHKKILILNNQ